MPGMDGYETASLIREREQTARIPIIFLSAVNKETEHLMRGYAMGAVDYVFKPVDPLILKSKVGVFVDLYNMRLRSRKALPQAGFATPTSRRNRAAEIDASCSQRERAKPRSSNRCRSCFTWNRYRDSPPDFVSRRFHGDDRLRFRRGATTLAMGAAPPRGSRTVWPPTGQPRHRDGSRSNIAGSARRQLQAFHDQASGV